MGGRPSRSSRTGQESNPKVRDLWVALPEFQDDWEAISGVWEGSKGPPGGPGWV